MHALPAAAAHLHIEVEDSHHTAPCYPPSLDVTDASIIRLAQNCPHLHKLVICKCCRLTSASVLALALHCPMLQLLDASGCSFITEQTMISASRSLRFVGDCWHRTWCDGVDRGGVAGGTGMLTWHSRFSGCGHTTFAESSLSRYATMTACHSHSGLCATCLTTTLIGAPTTCSGQSQDGGGRGCACHPDELPRTVRVVARVLTSAAVWPTLLTAVCDCAIGLGGSARQTNVTPSMQASKSVLVATASRW